MEYAGICDAFANHMQHIICTEMQSRAVICSQMHGISRRMQGVCKVCKAYALHMQGYAVRIICVV